ncbi:phage terminase large subunit [Enterococcus avium]|uniref:phage terminase large subunit n=1 Tax=Enterococcus avium TaxID=33945 RepID=UPI002412F47D|nr:phage terminase large subunit [Enterococcus avium]
MFPTKIYNTFLSPKHFKSLFGGRASLKSGSIARYVVLTLFCLWAQDQQASAVIVRKLKENLRKTVFAEVQKAINALELRSYFSTNYSPLGIRCGSNEIFFEGANGEDKVLKGVAAENVRFLWLEEADQFDDARHINDIVATFARDFTPDYEVIVSFNPPSNRYHWIFKEIEKKKYKSQKVTYLDDDKGFLSDELLEVINELKESDFELYKEIYLGEVDVKKRKYFRTCKIHDRQPSPKDFVFAGIDASTTGNDKTMLSIARYSTDDRVIYHDSFEIIDTKDWLDGETFFENMQLIEERLYENRVMFVVIDRGGGGQGIVDYLSRDKSKPYQVRGVYFGNKPESDKRSISFNNFRTQIFYQLSDYMNHGILQMRQDDLALVMPELNYFEFSRVKADEKKEFATRLQLNKKEDIKLLLGHSPDYSDALALCVEACRYALFS